MRDLLAQGSCIALVVGMQPAGEDDEKRIGRRIDPERNDIAFTGNNDATKLAPRKMAD